MIWSSRTDIRKISEQEWQILKLCLNAGAFRFLGIDAKKYIRWHTDFETHELCLEWE